MGHHILMKDLEIRNLIFAGGTIYLKARFRETASSFLRPADLPPILIPSGSLTIA